MVFLANWRMIEMCFLEVWCYFEQVRRLMSESRVQVQAEMIDLDLYTFLPDLSEDKSRNVEPKFEC